MANDFSWVDRRWQESYWLEVFRIRLCGWLPADLTPNAVANGLFLKVSTIDGTQVALTQKAHQLTDITKGIGESQNNCLMLANVLITNGFEGSWFKRELDSHSVFLQRNQVFPKRFRNKIMGELNSIANDCTGPIV